MKPTDGLKEADVSPMIVQAVQATGCQIWRNNSGLAKFGPRWVRYGVGKGGSDHLGYLPVRVTEAMVGQIIAVFVAIESKRPKGAEYTQDQIDFIANAKAAGAIAGFATSWEKGRAIVSDWFAKFIPPAKKPNRIKK